MDAQTRPRTLKRRHKALIAAALAFAVLLGWVVLVPFPTRALTPDTITSTQILDRDGRQLREVLSAKEGRGRWLWIDDISPHLVRATIHAEDKRFRNHWGVDPIAIGRSAWLNISNQRLVSGASTLSQQTVKMIMPRKNRRSLTEKAMEAIWAIRLERAVDKDSILEQYLNRAPYGNQLFGAEAAARAYFGKPATHLTLAEAALLAGLPQAPTVTEPYRHRTRAIQRQRTILQAMRTRGAITDEVYHRAITEDLTFKPLRGEVLAPHFTDHVLREVRKNNGLLPPEIITTLDLELQNKAEGIVRLQLERLAERNVSQASAVVLDTRSGEVLAWVGSRGYWDEARLGANDGVLAKRQPGSTLKPFVYGLYMEKGGTAADMFLDVRTHFPTDTGTYIPKNYDQKDHGPVSLRDALGSSLNVPAVIAAAEVGVEPLLKRLQDLGMKSLDKDPNHYGLGLSLGDGEISLLELAGAYATLGRMGRARPVVTVPNRRVEPKTRKVFEPEVAYQLLDILSDDEARAVGFGRHGPLALPYRVASKTGTSTDFRDNWAVGVTPDYTVAVWAGNFDGSAMHRASGITGAAPILRQLFQALYPTAAGPADVAWPQAPRSLRRHTVCTLSGQPATQHCAHTHTELFSGRHKGASGHPEIGGDRAPGPDRCQMHKTVPIDMRNGLRAGEGCDPAFVEHHLFHALPASWVAWGHEREMTPPPSAWSPLCPGRHAQKIPAGDAEVQIIHPLQDDRFKIDLSAPPETRTIALKGAIESAHTGTRMTWYVNGIPQATVGPPYTTSWRPKPGRYTLGLGRGKIETTIDVTVE